MLQKLLSNYVNRCKDLSQNVENVIFRTFCTFFIAFFVHFVQKQFKNVVFCDKIILGDENMYRKIEEELKKWYQNESLPLMLIGARQTGKTYILNKFCKQYYSNCIYINLEKSTEISSIFDKTLDPQNIIKNIEIIMETEFNVENTIIFFDEIQACEKAITSLKYFAESNIPYKIVCAGSLLGVKINREFVSFPVGKVIIKYLYPLDFEEFLINLGEKKLIEEIKSHYQSNEPLIDAVHNKALELYKTYMILGGMPKIIEDYINNKSISPSLLEYQDMIISSYLADMNKYTINTESIKNNKIYLSIPKELARENNTFKYSIVNEQARKIRYENSIDWLVASNMVLKCNLTEKNESPLKAYENTDKFKLYLSDIGLLRALSNISPNEILLEKNKMFSGVLSENYVATELMPKTKELFYYTFANYEIDFLININGDIIPIEVKAGRRNTSKSLNEYINKYKPSFAIRISTKNFGFENNIKSVPLYAVFCIKTSNQNEKLF